MAAETIDGNTLERRLRLIEDRFENYNLIARHPLSADTGAGAYTASVWTEDGVFDRGAEFPRPSGGRRWVVEPRAPPGDRAGDRPFCRPSLCADQRATLPSRFPICRSSYRTVTVRYSMSPIMAPRAAFTSIAFQPIARSSSAPTKAGTSSARPCARSTGPQQRARFWALRWSRESDQYRPDDRGRAPGAARRQAAPAQLDQAPGSRLLLLPVVPLTR